MRVRRKRSSERPTVGGTSTREAIHRIEAGGITLMSPDVGDTWQFIHRLLLGAISRRVSYLCLWLGRIRSATVSALPISVDP
jgi:hypothetical protein